MTRRRKLAMFAAVVVSGITVVGVALVAVLRGGPEPPPIVATVVHYADDGINAVLQVTNRSQRDVMFYLTTAGTTPSGRLPLHSMQEVQVRVTEGDRVDIGCWKVPNRLEAVYMLTLDKLGFNIQIETWTVTVTLPPPSPPKSRVP